MTARILLLGLYSLEEPGLLKSLVLFAFVLFLKQTRKGNERNENAFQVRENLWQNITMKVYFLLATAPIVRATKGGDPRRKFQFLEDLVH